MKYREKKTWTALYSIKKEILTFNYKLIDAGYGRILTSSNYTPAHLILYVVVAQYIICKRKMKNAS